jgi:poly(3-hydroxybutyrate) depolymerase
MTYCLRLLLMVLLTIPLAVTATCNRKREVAPDRPSLTPNVGMHDVHFHSTALNREISYRVLMPAKAPGAKLPVVYLLHGGGGGSFRDWSNYSDVAHFAELGLVLVMPEADKSYYKLRRAPARLLRRLRCA